MSYMRKNWKDGEVITAEGLNNLEEGVTEAKREAGKRILYTDIVDNLESTATNLPLSAKQGNKLKGDIEKANGNLFNKATSKVDTLSDGRTIFKCYNDAGNGFEIVLNGNSLRFDQLIGGSVKTITELNNIILNSDLSNMIKHVTITKTTATGSSVGLIYIPISEYPNAKAIIPLGYCTSAIYKVSGYKNSGANFILIAQKATDNTWADSVEITFEAYVIY